MRPGATCRLAVGDRANHPEIVRQVVVQQIGVRHIKIPCVTPRGPPRIPDDEDLRLIVVSDRHDRVTSDRCSSAPGMGTLPLLATRSDSKLGNTVNPNTNGYPEPRQSFMSTRF